MNDWSMHFRGVEFREPTYTLFESRGDFFVRRGEHVEQIDDPVGYLRRRATTDVIAGAIAYEFAWELDDVHAQKPPSAIPSLFIGGFETTTDASFDAPVDGELSDVVAPDRARYVEDVGACRDAIWAGELFEVNYTGRFDAAWSGSPDGLFALLASRSGGDYMGLLRADEFAIVSVSPECFLEIGDGTVTTRPIKGTRRSESDPELDRKVQEELLNSEKDRAENVMIVDLMRNDLARFCVPGTVQVTALCELETYPGLHHLVSEVVGEFAPDVSPIDALFGCFPAGSITGAPKLRAIEIAAEREKRPRDFYTGSLFVSWPDGRLESSVAIRTATLTRDRARWNVVYGAGGAVVADSDPESEYREALLKASYLRASP